MKNTQLQNSIGGIAANSVMRPIIIILVLLHASIIGMILQINSTTGQLSSVMNKAGTETGEATSVLAGASLLCQTSTNFVLVPVTPFGQTNIRPLTVYANELNVPRRGNQVLARFREYNVGEKPLSYLTVAADCADNMVQSQLRAFALMNAVYPLPDRSPVNKLPLPALTEAEKALPDEQKIAQARALVLDANSAQEIFFVSQNIKACVEMIRADADAKAAEAGRRIAILRYALWGATLLILIILTGTFITLYRQLINPLQGFVRLIASNQSLNDEEGLQEVRQVASSYNNLRKRRDALQSVAETDTLTNLPNRYRFEQYLLGAGDRGFSLAILMLDINYLKETNDKLGHSAGDELIRRAANCIASCFGENSFRIGGDEFAAVVKDCKPEELQEMIERFEEAKQKANVSISLGYAYTDEISETTLKDMIEKADKQMYAQKQQAHRRQ